MHWHCALLKASDQVALQVRDYIVQLEAHLAEVHRQSQRMIERQSKLGLSMSEFGASMVALGKFESGTLAQKFTKLGERADSLSGASQVRLFTMHSSALLRVQAQDLAGFCLCLWALSLCFVLCCNCNQKTAWCEALCHLDCLWPVNGTHLFLYHWLQKQSEQLMTTFEAPLKEFVRAVKSAKSVMTDRSTALGLLQQVRPPGLMVHKHILTAGRVRDTFAANPARPA